ncbi:GFA family protein [Aliikangiella marina]|uniref:GFA family protein n=1 Tax=Aliikangiella marina TaxID=1712262 RepID=A0A545T4Z5_9GAMM|nr:GFA family protein [Aliikangiella marina]TQV72232.1 GFA family protein [Aliikangiella marina]
MKFQGSCHCKAIQFEIEAPNEIEVEDCNCSMCSKAGFLHLILPLEHFKLLCGEEYISTYTFNSGVAKHTFCKKCGVKPFYTPRSNPDGIDVNVRCLDTKPTTINVVKFDGQNWEDNAHKVAHKSQVKNQ